MKIEILGSGCKNCDDLHANVLSALEHMGLRDEATVDKVKDIDEIMRMGVYATPGLVIDGDVISAGRVLSAQQIVEKLRARTTTASG